MNKIKNTDNESCQIERIVIPPVLIQQRYKGDCAVASLAMFLGITYDEILEHFVKELEDQFSDGIWNSKVFEVAKKYGVELTCIYKEFDLTRRSLVIVPSLIAKDRQHTIFWDGDNVYDPSPLKIYDELPKSIAYIYREYN